MTTTIAPVTMYPCPVSGRLYKTERGARASAKRELEKQEQEAIKLKEAQKAKEEKEAERDWLRMNLEDINDLPVLMKQRAKELYNWDLDVSFDLWFSNVSNSHSCPIGGVTNWGQRGANSPTSYPGWSGQIRGTLKGKVPKTTFMGTIADLIKEKFRVIHTGTGGPGRPNEYDMRIGCQLFLDDFPKLKEKYEFYIVERQKERTNDVEFNNLYHAASNYALNHEEVVKADKLMARIRMIKDNKFKEYLNQYAEQNKKEPIPLHEDYQKLKEMFS
jgi:hypothetical protein